MKRRRVVEYMRVVDEFTDEEPPSLTAIPVDGEDVTDVRPKPPVKTSRDYFPWFKAAGEGK